MALISQTFVNRIPIKEASIVVSIKDAILGRIYQGE